MSPRPHRAGLAVFIGLVLASPLVAQDISGRTVVYGRVEDAVSREPIAGAHVFAADSSSAVFTDSVGTFAIPLPRGDSLAVYAEQYGYLSERYDLDADAPSRMSVLLLEPAPLEIQGFDIVDDAVVTVLVDNLEKRRLSYGAAATAFDRAQLDRFAPVGSVWDFVHTRHSEVHPCADGSGQLCVRGVARTLQTTTVPDVPVLVCVDGWRSTDPLSELESLDISSTSLVEFYNQEDQPGLGQVRVYTALYMVDRVRRSQTNVRPLRMGC